MKLHTWITLILLAAVLFLGWDKFKGGDIGDINNYLKQIAEMRETVTNLQKIVGECK